MNKEKDTTNKNNAPQKRTENNKNSSANKVKKAQ